VRDNPMLVYTRKKNSVIWHICRNCSKYPTGNKVTVRATKPEDGEVCKECQAKAKNGR
jgi:hypothetical protein